MTSEQVLSHFREILTIPRESGHEEHIIAWLQKFAADRHLDCKTDEAGNVLITIPATPGRENSPTVILQSHSDMVCEKNSGVEHDFSKDPIKAVVENGWLIAKDTTLGADCGIGIAAQLAVLEDKELPHGKIECLFTTSEETGLDGAFALKGDFLTGSILLNLDSEDEGELFIGCAGGIDTTAKFHYTPVPVPAGKVCVKAGFCGGIGGHSGDDIDKGRSNAVQSLARLLYRVWNGTSATLCSIDGGNKRNAIAREASAVIAVNPSDTAKVKGILDETLAELRDEYAITDPDIGNTGYGCGRQDRIQPHLRPARRTSRSDGHERRGQGTGRDFIQPGFRQDAGRQYNPYRHQPAQLDQLCPPQRRHAHRGRLQGSRSRSHP